MEREGVDDDGVCGVSSLLAATCLRFWKMTLLGSPNWIYAWLSIIGADLPHNLETQGAYLVRPSKQNHIETYHQQTRYNTSYLDSYSYIGCVDI